MSHVQTSGLADLYNKMDNMSSEEAVLAGFDPVTQRDYDAFFRSFSSRKKWLLQLTRYR